MDKVSDISRRSISNKIRNPLKDAVKLRCPYDSERRHKS